MPVCTAMNRIVLLLAFPLVLAVSPLANAQEEKLELLLDRSPALPNAMGYVNVASLDKLMNDAGMSAGVTQNVDEYWFVSDFDVAKTRPKWEAGYINLKDEIDAEALAKKLGGYVDEISGHDAIWTPGQTYLVPVKDNRLGILRPADRTLLSEWLSGERSYRSSAYLKSQAKPPEDYLSLMLAIDLQDALSPVPMADKLKDNFKSLQSNSPESVASVLASVQGVTVLIGRRGLNECIVRATFSKSPASLELIAADLFAEILERGGTAAPEVRTWKVEIKDNGLALKGPITEATLSGLLGVFSLQNKARQAVALNGSEAGSRTQEEEMAYRSKAYFADVTKIVEQTRKHKSQTTGALAKWNDARARQIAEIGTLNVDPGMIQYGTDVAETLRGNALTVRQGNITGGKTKASQGLSDGYYGGGYGYDYNSSTDYQRVTDAYARGNAYSNYQQALAEIDKMTASVRRTMSDKYQIQF
ncbi:hypothetical protein SAMN06265222_101813 [Neorhodopirellula lusitana]|uniref:Uncharacterized protein n=1 Tax=Neorhodopirellula lusitana TaxID=445327 RepID=A0ABY1PQI2_9BACT|nr:hypothetical protein [Neorhodopirellula lusitana]SMP42620.1 hypothetical protein SAMN06265222_101813 [Neorhodopirellula lusitana]